MKKSLNVYVDMVCDLFHSNHVYFMEKAIEAGKEKHLKSFCIRINEYSNKNLDRDLQPIINIDYE